jgi:hypothetical protein
VKYVIHERELFSSYPSGNVAPFNWRPYSGPAPHDDHGHISTLPEGDTDTRPWAIVPDMAEKIPLEDWAVPAFTWAVANKVYTEQTDLSKIREPYEFQQLMVALWRVGSLRKGHFAVSGGGLSRADVTSIINDSQIVAP